MHDKKSEPLVDSGHVFVYVLNVVFRWQELVEIVDGRQQFLRQQRLTFTMLPFLRGGGGGGECKGVNVCVCVCEGRGECKGVNVCVCVCEGRGECKGVNVCVCVCEGRGECCASIFPNLSLQFSVSIVYSITLITAPSHTHTPSRG